MSPHPEDDGFHEIQLNGKQLVFVFMALTVVSVVIFLCGVLVGRGVQSERALAQGAEPPAELKELALDPAKAVIPPTVQPGSDPTLAPPPAPPEGEQSKGIGTESPGAATASAKDARLKADTRAAEKRQGPGSGRSTAVEPKASVSAGVPAPPKTPLPRDAVASTEPAARDAKPLLTQQHRTGSSRWPP